MGICIPSSEKKKYKESEDQPTDKIDSISLKSEDFISGLSAQSSFSFIVAQESTLSLYSDFLFSSS